MLRIAPARGWLRFAAMVPAVLALAGLSLILATRPAPPAAALATETLVLAPPAADTYLSEAAPGDIHDGVLLNISGDAAAGERRWAGIRFDLSALPAGVAITSATLHLTVENSASEPMTLTPIRLGPGAAWDEGATWQSASAAWNSGTLGQPVAITEVTTAADFDVTADVAAFAGGAANNGWVIRALAGTGTVGFAASEAAVAAARPTLTITYTIPAVTLQPTAPAYTTDAPGGFEDTTITSDDPSGNRSGLDSLTIGRTAGSNSEALLRFPLGADLSGAQIVEATLTLSTLAGGQPRTLGVARICQPPALLDPGAVAAASYAGVPYGALAPVQTAPAAFADGQETFTVDVTAIVQTWAAGEPNLGLVIAQLTGPLADTVRFHSFNAATAALRPQLEIRYLPGQGSVTAPACGATATATSTPTPTATTTVSPSATATQTPTATVTASPSTSPTPAPAPELVVTGAGGAVARSRLTFVATDSTGTATSGRFVIRGKASNHYFNATTGAWEETRVENPATKGTDGSWQLAVTGAARRGIANTTVVVEFRALLGTAEAFSATSVELVVR